MRKLILVALSKIRNVQDHFDLKFLKNEALPSLDIAIKAVHLPSDNQIIDNAYYRLKFDELFFLQLLMALKKKYISNKKGISFINRGPYVKGRILDCSYGAAKKLGFINEGTANVEIKVIEWGDGEYMHHIK